jgi:hypothetical protein
MTNNAELAVELTESYAQVVGDDVRLVVRLPDDSTVGGRDMLQLKKGKRVVRIPVSHSASSTGTILEATVPIEQIGSGTWRLGLASDTERPMPLEARLVYNHKQPVALLPGPLPATVLPPPVPAARRPTSPSRSGLYTAMARVANRALRALPDERAARVRASLTKVERRLRG